MRFYIEVPKRVTTSYPPLHEAAVIMAPALFMSKLEGKLESHLCQRFGIHPQWFIQNRRNLQRLYERTGFPMKLVKVRAGDYRWYLAARKAPCGEKEINDALYCLQYRLWRNR